MITIPEFKYLIGIPIAAGALYYASTMISAEQEELAQTGGPDYTLSNLTRAKVSRWSKVKLIEHGFWDDKANAMLPTFYALPAGP
jgi:hypothetical protein